MLADLGVVKSHSRPHTSNDNPFSEAHFKTMKYQPEFLKRFETNDETRAFCRRLFLWYNEDHNHTGVGLMTPDQIHFGQANSIYATRQKTLDGAFLSTPPALRPQAAKTTSNPNRCLDKSTKPNGRRTTLKSKQHRLKNVDAFRDFTS